MRGGTSKGLYFVADDLPAEPAARDELLLRIMGSPDARQIDGMGGAHPLTSKVAVVSPRADGVADVDYHFLQVVVDEAVVTDRQNCGNLLAGVGPFALERGLVAAPDGDTAAVRIHMVNTGGLATATVPLRDGRPRYDGDHGHLRRARHGRRHPPRLRGHRRLVVRRAAADRQRRRRGRAAWP